MLQFFISTTNHILKNPREEEGVIFTQLFMSCCVLVSLIFQVSPLMSSPFLDEHLGNFFSPCLLAMNSFTFLSSVHVFTSLSLLEIFLFNI